MTALSIRHCGHKRTYSDISDSKTSPLRRPESITQHSISSSGAKRIMRTSASGRQLRQQLTSLPVRIQGLWKNLFQKTTELGDFQYSNDPQLHHNQSQVGCIEKNIVKVRCGEKEYPIHANTIDMKPLGSDERSPAGRLYIAGQSPSPSVISVEQSNDAADTFSTCEKYLYQGIESGQGLFQFVSTRTHFDQKNSTEKSIITQFISQLESQGNIVIGNRYLVTNYNEVNLVEVCSKKAPAGLPESRHKTLLLSVYDQDSHKEFTVPITQVGFHFTNKLLTADDIKHANDFLELHQSLRTTDTSPAENGSPMILSYAGVGRNAALIAYREVVARIDEGKINTTHQLQEELEDVILRGRACRSPKFIHSIDQYNQLLKSLERVLEVKNESNSQIINSFPYVVGGNSRISDDHIFDQEPIDRSEPSLSRNDPAVLIAQGIGTGTRDPRARAFSPEYYKCKPNLGHGSCLFYSLAGYNLPIHELTAIRKAVANVVSKELNTPETLIRNQHYFDNLRHDQKISVTDFTNATLAKHQKNIKSYAGNLEIKQWLSLDENINKKVIIIYSGAESEGVSIFRHGYEEERYSPSTIKGEAKDVHETIKNIISCAIDPTSPEFNKNTNIAILSSSEHFARIEKMHPFSEPERPVRSRRR